MENKEFILDQVTIKKLLTIYKLKIPDFQRSFVWKQSKKEQLLESLFRGFPIGAITLYEDEGEYYVIDGLQRINTLNQYLSCPSMVIPFNKFYMKVSEDVAIFLQENGLSSYRKQMEQCIRNWYERLNKLYEFEKVSVLNNILVNAIEKIAELFRDLTKVEELLDIVKGKIEIVHDDVALIIYKGDKDDLPELFKNINTGSVALSQYEILQSVWINYTLDKNVLKDTYNAFDKELELLKNDYEIKAIRDAGRFDIFKNIMGLNHLICCIKDCYVVFSFPAFKKRTSTVQYMKEEEKYFDNDSIAFEIYSTILCNASNRIVRAVDMLYENDKSIEEISEFIRLLNSIILEAINIAIEEIQNMKIKMIESKYHSLYVLMGIIWSQYDIDIKNLIIRKIPINHQLYQESLNLSKHRENKWFVDENRQVGFFNIKIEELMDLKKEIAIEKSGGNTDADIDEGILRIKVNGEIIQGNSVKSFYRSIITCLIEKNVIFDKFLPYATGKKRYLISKTGKHINGEPFISPICIDGYYIETHKNKSGATRDIYNFLRKIGVPVEYV